MHGVISGDANDEPPPHNDDAGAEPGCEHGRATGSDAPLRQASATAGYYVVNFKLYDHFLSIFYTKNIYSRYRIL